MSHFSHQLGVALSRLSVTRASLATQSGVPYASLTNYALDRRRPDTQAMAQLCQALPRHEAADLLLARLRDELPEAFADLVAITPADPITALEEPAALYDAVLDPKLRAALDAIARAAVKTHEWRDLVLDLARIV
jgi:transcriptional regulator with XRE-family HTH domain